MPMTNTPALTASLLPIVSAFLEALNLKVL
jgi:hypothetical protein